MKKKIVLTIGAILIVVGGVAVMSAYEAHVINVVAHIENALTVDTTPIEFGTVFPEEVFEMPVTIALSSSFMKQAECSDVNLLGNGGFEMPVVTHTEGWDIFPSGNTDLVWKVEWVAPSVNAPTPALQELHAGVNGWLPAEGDQYAELDADYDGPDGSLNGEQALVRIYQDISTVFGRKYILTYKFSPRPETGSDDNILYVKIDGNLKQTQQDAGGSNTNWSSHVLEFIADSSITRIEFEGGGTNNSLGVFLDAVELVECGRVTTVDYAIRQKPKCWSETEQKFGRVTEEGDVFVCIQPEEGAKDYEMLPLLCPYLSKHDADPEDGNDDAGVDAFHGPIDNWTMSDTLQWQVNGELSVPIQDITDEWTIDLHVPCFEGMCAQDGVIPVKYQPDPSLDGETFGCDLWIEVTGIDGIR